jgi:hypothetical protein
MGEGEMKTYTILGIMLVTGKDKDKVEKLAAGTHFLTAYGDKRGGPRKKHEDPKCGNLKICPKDMKYSSYCYKDCEHRGTEDSHVSD